MIGSVNELQEEQRTALGKGGQDLSASGSVLIKSRLLSLAAQGQICDLPSSLPAFPAFSTTKIDSAGWLA